MKRSLPAFVLAALVAGTVPAFANIGPIELPLLTFPDPTGPVVDQGCSQPATPSPDRCELKDG